MIFNTFDMSGIDKEGLKLKIDTATPAQLERIKAIFDVQEETGEQVDEVLASSETMEVDPRLTKFAEMYNKWSPESKLRLDWKRVQAAMLANDGALLKQAEAIPNGPVMFGADKEGNILFANGGVEPILTGKNYSTARKATHALGLELFPYIKPYEKSEEELMFEEFTGKPIVKSEDGKTWRSTYLEDGDNDENVGYARVSRFFPDSRESIVCYGVASGERGGRGVRGLLRAKA